MCCVFCSIYFTLVVFFNNNVFIYVLFYNFLMSIKLSAKTIEVVSKLKDGDRISVICRNFSSDNAYLCKIMKVLEVKGIIRKECWGRSKFIYLTDVGLVFQKSCREVLALWGEN